MRTRKPTLNPIDALLRNAFGVAMALQASIINDRTETRAKKIVRELQSWVATEHPEVAQIVEVRLAEGRRKPARPGGALCGMMIPPRGRLDGSGYIAAVLLKVLVVAYLETKGTHLPIDLKAWQDAAGQDQSAPGLRTAISGHERQLADALTSLFSVTHEEGLRPFTALCRSCVEAMNGPKAIALPGGAHGCRLPKDIAIGLFGGSLVRDLTLETADAELKIKRANALSKLGKALQHKIKFLKAGGCKNG